MSCPNCGRTHEDMGANPSEPYPACIANLRADLAAERALCISETNRANENAGKLDQQYKVSAEYIKRNVDLRAERYAKQARARSDESKARVTSAAALPKEYMVPNEKMLDALAKASKGAMKIPGVEFYTESILAVGK